MKLTIKWGKIKEYFLVLFITMVLTYIILRIDSIKWNLPISYYWDGLLSSFEIKTISDTGWWFKNPYLGAPFGASFYDYKGFYFDSFYLVIIKIILLFTKNWGIALNIFYISIYPITSLISYFVMRKFKINFLISLMGSLVFTFLEYRFLRGGFHLYLSAYYLIPLVTLCIYYIYINDDILVFNKDYIKNKKNIMVFMVFFLLPMTGVYYTFFTCLFLAIILLIKIKQIEIIKKIFTAYGCMVFSILLLYLPGIVYNFQNVQNFEKPYRAVLESEYYGLRISNFFISKKVEIFSIPRIKEYFNYIMESGENSEYLGIVGVLGILYLLYYLFKKKKSNKKIELLSYLTIGGILFSVKSGFGVLFSIYVTGLIRGYNRISVFIAYFSILAICIKINNIVKNRHKFKLFYNLIIIIIFSISIWDQIPKDVRYNNQAVTEYNYKSSREKYEKIFNSDKKFVSYIENQLGENGMVFQLPYFKFPESGYVGSISDYQMMKGYLHSKKIKWSYGSYKGRNEDLWNRQISNLPISEILEKISIVGFNGIYINKNGYNNDDYKKLEKEIKNITGAKPYFSEDETLVFFNIKGYSDTIKNKYSKKQLSEKKEKILNEFITTDGIYDTEFLGTTEKVKQNWAKNEIIIYVINNIENNKIFNFNSKVFTPSLNMSSMEFDVNGNKHTYSISKKGTYINFSVKLKKGRNVIKIKTNAPKYYAPLDTRELYIRFENLKMEIK